MGRYCISFQGVNPLADKLNHEIFEIFSKNAMSELPSFSTATT